MDRLENDIVHAGLNLADDLTAMRDVLEKATAALAEAKQEHREGLPVLGTLALANALGKRKNNIEKFTRILDNVDGEEQLDEAPEKYAALAEIQQRQCDIAEK